MIANGNKYYSVNFESSARTLLIQQDMQQEDQNDEHVHIAKYKDLVKRESKNLLLKMNNGKDVVLKNTDNPEGAEN